MRPINRETEHRDDGRVPQKGGDQFRVVFGRVFQVGILNEDPVSGRMRQGRSDRRALSPVPEMADHPDNVFVQILQYGSGPVGGAVIHHDDFPVNAFLNRHVPDTFDHGLKRILLVVNGNHDG